MLGAPVAPRAADPVGGTAAPAATSARPAGGRSGASALGPGLGAGLGATARRTGSTLLHDVVRTNLTARALALVVVVLVLTISYATSLRIYFAQAHEIASTKAEIAGSQEAIGDLQGRIARWNDPAYVTARARERLGWVVPGETGYTVVGADGKPLGGGLTLDSAAPVDPQPQAMWWDRMWGSVKAADQPAVKKAEPDSDVPVTPETTPR